MAVSRPDGSRSKRAAARTPHHARALGADRFRILQHFLAESTVIALAAGTIGVGLAFGSLAILRPLIPADVQLARDATVNGTVLLFTLIIASLTALATGIFP